MSKKQTLINEATCRRWSQLVGTTLTPQRLNEMGYGPDQEQEIPPGQELPTEDVPEVPEEEKGSEDENLVKDLVTAIADAIQDVSGIPVEVEGGVEAPEGEEAGEEGEEEDELGEPEGLEGEKEEDEEEVMPGKRAPSAPVMEVKEEEEEEEENKKPVMEVYEEEEEEKKPMDEDGRGKSGDEIEPDRHAKGSGRSNRTTFTESMVAEIAKRVSARLLKKN